MIRLEAVYWLAGGLFAAFAGLSALDRNNPKRWGNAAFWGLFATSFLFGSRLSDLANGILVLAMVAIAGIGGLGLGRPATTSPETRRASALRLGNWLFLPALTIPAVTLFGALVLKTVKIGGVFLIDPKQATVISLALGVLAALAFAAVLLRPPPLAAFQEGRRLIDTVGWAAVLPQMLASLGAVFALAGVGGAVGTLVSHAIPVDSRLAVVCAYTIGMALFTMIMGNGFAAFPVMTAGIGLPLIVVREVPQYAARFPWLADSPERALRVARRLRTGQVRLNKARPVRGAPFGGYRESGNGREGSRHGIDEFTEIKYLCIDGIGL